MVANLATKLGNSDVFGMNGVGIEARAVSEDDDDAGVVRSWQPQYVEASRQAHDLWDCVSQAAQQSHVLFANFVLNVGAIFPDNNVCQHGA